MKFVTVTIVSPLSRVWCLCVKNDKLSQIMWNLTSNEKTYHRPKQCCRCCFFLCLSSPHTHNRRKFKVERVLGANKFFIPTLALNRTHCAISTLAFSLCNVIEVTTRTTAAATAKYQQKKNRSRCGKNMKKCRYSECVHECMNVNFIENRKTPHRSSKKRRKCHSVLSI